MCLVLNCFQWFGHANLNIGTLAPVCWSHVSRFFFKYAIVLENLPIDNVDVEFCCSVLFLIRYRHFKRKCLLYLLHLCEAFDLLVITCYLQNTRYMSFYMCNHFFERIKHFSWLCFLFARIMCEGQTMLPSCLCDCRNLQIQYSYGILI